MQKHLDALLQQHQLHTQKLKQQDAECSKAFVGLPLIKVRSLRKLYLYGSWVIPDGILMTMLELVFQNVDTLTMSDCSGFSMQSLVRVTQFMPQMGLVHTISQMEPGSPLSDTCKLKLYDGKPISPFETDAAARAMYKFGGMTPGFDGQGLHP
jgi:hypothetical protein